MSDISQQGLICTLQRLREHPTLDDELARLTRDAPAALILPCHAGEFARPALRHILAELSRAPFFSEVIIPANGLDAEGAERARAFLAERLRLPHRLLWCDPLVAALPGVRPGKGSNVWLALGLLAHEGRARYLLTADADVATFRLEMLSRLLFALAHPEAGFHFAKSYYPRVSDRIYGRVTRLFVAPLLQALIRAAGHFPLLDFLASFRYPLAGECGMTLELARALPLESGWGLEVGMLCELFRREEPRAVCQVDAGIAYDHKHQPLGDGMRGLVRMSGEIARTLLAQLSREGLRLDTHLLDALPGAYRREAAEAVRFSGALARINALPFDARAEADAITLFATALEEATREQAAPAPLPAWKSPHAPDWSTVAGRGAAGFSLIPKTGSSEIKR